MNILTHGIGMIREGGEKKMEQKNISEDLAIHLTNLSLCQRIRNKTRKAHLRPFLLGKNKRCARDL